MRALPLALLCIALLPTGCIQSHERDAADKDLARERTARATRDAGAPARPTASAPRSEEHTSELQSRIRTPYAVFCLKKKIKKI